MGALRIIVLRPGIVKFGKSGISNFEPVEMWQVEFSNCPQTNNTTSGSIKFKPFIIIKIYYKPKFSKYNLVLGTKAITNQILKSNKTLM